MCTDADSKLLRSQVLDLEPFYVVANLLFDGR